MDSRQNNNILTNIVIYLTFFLLGFFVCIKYIEYKEQNISVQNVKNSEETALDLSKFFTVYDLLKEYHYDFEKIEKKDFINSSIVGLTQGLGDSYTEYFTKEEEKNFMETLSGDFQGIGAILEKDDLGVKIAGILENSPAEKADIRAGDIIINVNGEDIGGMKTSEVISLIKGPSGKEVNLKIIREEDLIEKKLYTGEVTIPSINSKDLNDEIGYIQVSTFGEKTGSEFEKKLYEFKDKKGIIIDLRQNSGGYLDTATEIIGHFIKKGEVISFTKYKDGKEDKYISQGNGTLYNGKIVILIDRFSASASEIFAGAMKDYKKAILVGEKSFGKGSVQQPINLKDGGMVKITVAKWFTPLGINIDKEGINPDVEIKFTKEDLENKYDRQLEESKKVLKSYIENNLFQISIDKYNENNK